MFRSMTVILLVASLTWGCSNKATGRCLDGDQCDAAGIIPDAQQSGGDSAVSADADVGADAGPDAGVDPDDTLIIEQIYIPGVLSGESALIIGPDGTSVLIDVGNDSHAPEVREAVMRRVGTPTVDWLIITHNHGDHYGAVDNLFDPGSDQIVVQRGIVTRGMFDVGDQVTSSDFQELCALHQSADWAGRTFDLCSGAQPAPCDGSETGAPWPASGCPGLLLGDLLDPSDDANGQASFLRLGGGARLTFFHANGRLVQHGTTLSAEDDGIVLGHGDTESENSRSLGGVVRWGDFVYTFDGDLTGAGDKVVPDVEGWIATHADGIVTSPGGALLIPTGGLDVAKLSHHGLKSATQQGWADWLFPGDGLSRNAVVGANLGYGYSPSSQILDRLGPRVSAGYIWVTQAGLLAGTDPSRRDANGAVVVRVTGGGGGYEVFAWAGGTEQLSQSYTSTPAGAP